MSYIPRNAKEILRNSKMMREFALNPFGLKTPTTYQFPKSHPEYKFFQQKMLLHRPGPTEKIQSNTLVFKVDQKLSKPQIKQYLQKLYNLKIQKVNTARFMGRVKRNTFTRKPEVTKSFKKAFVITESKIPEFLNQNQNV